jgi:hypothetical protein
MIRFALIWLALCSVSLGQIKLTQEVTQNWVGFQNPRIVDGVIVAGVNSKPTLSSTSTTIKVETAVPYKFSQVKAVRLPSLERITLEQIDGGYRFKPSAPAGLYAIEYLAFDPEKGIASEEITVEIKPIEQVDPIKPEPIANDEVERIVFASINELRKGYGTAFRAAATAIERRDITVDAKLQSFLEPLTRTARTNAMAGIDNLIQAKLPRDVDKLRPESAKFIESIGLAFEKGTK